MWRSRENSWKWTKIEFTIEKINRTKWKTKIFIEFEFVVYKMFQSKRIIKDRKRSNYSIESTNSKWKEINRTRKTFQRSFTLLFIDFHFISLLLSRFKINEKTVEIMQNELKQLRELMEKLKKENEEYQVRSCWYF